MSQNAERRRPRGRAFMGPVPVESLHPVRHGATALSGSLTPPRADDGDRHDGHLSDGAAIAAPGHLSTAAVTDAVPPSVRVAGAFAWRLLAIVAATAVVLYLLAFFKTLIVPVAIAVLLATLLEPVVRFLTTRGRLARGAASGLAVVLLVLFVTALVTVAGRQIIQGFAQLRSQVIAGVQSVGGWLTSGPLQLSDSDVQGYLDQATDALQSNSSTVLSGALALTTTVGHVAAGTLIAVFCTLFFLVDGRGIWAWLVRLLPVPAREPFFQASRRGLVTLGAYVRTQILVALVDAVGIGLGALFFGLPLAIPLAILVFVGSFVPIVGALVTGGVAILVAAVDQGPGAALGMLGVVLAVQLIEGHVLLPLLMGHAVSLHAVAVLLAVAAGSMVAGIVGALFAVPIVAVLNTVVLYLHGHDKFPELAEEGESFTRRYARSHETTEQVPG